VAWSRRLTGVRETTKSFFGAGEIGLKQKSAPIASDQQRGSIMWNLASALIYFFVIVLRWRSSDVAEVRGAITRAENAARM
jgi:hypothetical protein